MKVIEISPFIRYCKTQKILSYNHYVSSVDCRLFYVINGKGSVYVDGKSYDFSKDTLMLWQGGYKYKFECENTVTLLVINFDYTTENSHVTEPYEMLDGEDASKFPKQIYFDDCKELNSPIILNNALYMNEAIKYLEKSTNEFTNQSPYGAAKTSAYFKTCVINLIENSSIPQNAKVGINIFEKIIDYVKSNYKKEISNNDIANVIGYHPYYLNKLFTERYGTTLHQYLINYRLILAENLLTATDKSINEIALECGFSSAISLTVNFKNKHDLTPTQYRKKHEQYV